MVITHAHGFLIDDIELIAFHSAKKGTAVYIDDDIVGCITTDFSAVALTDITVAVFHCESAWYIVDRHLRRMSGSVNCKCGCMCNTLTNYFNPLVYSINGLWRHLDKLPEPTNIVFKRREA